MSNKVVEKIKVLKKAKNAIILAHCYQPVEVDEVADYVGDSLYLSQVASKTDADIIVFAGVYFMAQTAKILSPEKKVLLPQMDAGCRMADMINHKQLMEFKVKNPNLPTVCYVNSTAGVKAECDICVTSGNAEKVMASLPRDAEIIFVPDQHLGSFIMEKFGVKYILWPGYCPTHARLCAASVEKARKAYPGAVVMVHPECRADVRKSADEVLK